MRRRKNAGQGTLTQEMPPGSFIRYSPEETETQVTWVEQAFSQGWSGPEIIRHGQRELGVPRGRMVKLIAKVRERFAREDSLARPSWKAEQIRRLMRQLRVAMGEKDPETGRYIVPPNLSAYAKLESILADVQGTREPIEINVDVSYTEAMMTVIGQLTPQQMDGLLERARERKRLAEAYSAMSVVEAPKG